MEPNPNQTWAPRDRREVERRKSERRRIAVAVAVDRRRNRDRRRFLRRSGEERRHRASRDVRFAERRLTPVPFSIEDTKYDEKTLEEFAAKKELETGGVPDENSPD